MIIMAMICTAYIYYHHYYPFSDNCFMSRLASNSLVPKPLPMPGDESKLTIALKLAVSI